MMHYCQLGYAKFFFAYRLLLPLMVEYAFPPLPHYHHLRTLLSCITRSTTQLPHNSVW